MRADVLTSIEGLRQIRRDWTALLDRAPCATPFQSPEWLLPWLELRFRGGEIRTAALWDGGRLAGLAPMFLWGAKRKAGLIGAGESDLLDLTAEPGAAAACAEAALAAIPGAAHFHDLPEWSALLRARTPLPFRAAACTPLPVLRLPESMEALEAALSRRHRHHLRNAENRLDRAGAVEYAATNCIDTLIALHSARWRARGECGVLGGAEAFHREVAAGFAARGWLRILELRVDGRPIAAMYGFQMRRRFYYYLGGFDPRWAAFSPGALLLRHALGRAITDGAAEFDFLRNPEPYKYRWGARDRWSWSLHLGR